jgi:hypothetical protein
MRLPILVAFVLALGLTACSSDEETVPDPTTSPAPTPTVAGDVTICPQIGVPGEATPSSPTPAPSCYPGKPFADVGPGIRGRIAESPPLPEGMTALTTYIEFETDDPTIGANISLPLLAPLPTGHDLSWYTYDSGAWRALRQTVGIHESTLSDQNAIAESDFNPLPANLILLAAQ